MYVVGYSIVLNTTRSLSLSEQFLLTYIRLQLQLIGYSIRLISQLTQSDIRTVMSLLLVAS